MGHNETNLHRSARALQHSSDLTYQQARTLLAGRTPRPDLSTPAAVAAFLASVRTASRPTAGTSPLTVHVTISDGVGFTQDTYELADLPDDLREVLTGIRPGQQVTWVAGDGGTWAVVTDPAVEVTTRIEWAAADLTFASSVATGNPGCDDCGMNDAVVKVDSRYLCASAAQQAGMHVPPTLETAWLCDECETTVHTRGAVSTEHDTTCSLHPDNVIS